MLLQAENVRRPPVEPAEIEKFLDALLAQPLDIERAAADEMAQTFEFLRVTDEPAGTADVDLPLLRDRLAATDGAMVGEDIGGAIDVAGQIVDDLRDHVARALDDHPVAGAHAEAADLVAVVERDVRDDDAADGDRGEPPHGGQLARAADLDVDGFQSGLRAFGGKFMRDRPARRLRDEAQSLLPVEPVDLIDDAVDIVRHLGALGLDHPVMRQHVGDALETLQKRRNGNTCLFDRIHDAELCVRGQHAHLAPSMSQKAQRARSSNIRVFLTQRSRCGVARVGELADGRGIELLPALCRERPALFHQPVVQRRKIGLGHKNLAANLKDIGKSERLFP